MAATMAGLLLLALPAAAGKIQRFTDTEGTLHITDLEGGEQTKTGPAGVTTTDRTASFPASPVVQSPSVQSPTAQSPSVQPPPSPPPEPEQEPPEEGEGAEESAPDEGDA